MKFNKGDILVPHDALCPPLTGTFQDFRLTLGSCGHQYSTIDGQEFITWFDLRNPALKGLQPGCHVEYETRAAPTVLCHTPRVVEPLPSATLFRVIHPGG